MSERDLYVEKMKARLDQWNAEIDRLEAASQNASAAVQEQYRQEIEALRQKRTESEEKLEALRQAGDDAWQDVKSGAELAWNAMDSALRSALSRFR